MLRRDAARPGDAIAVTGYPGSAAAGLEMLTKKLGFEPEAAAYLRNAFLRPVPRLAEGRLLVGQGVKAAIDISDGLAADLRHVCRASGVGARVRAGRLPLHPAVKANFGGRARELALGGGEDYELLFTAGEAIIGRVKESAACPVTLPYLHRSRDKRLPFAPEAKAAGETVSRSETQRPGIDSARRSLESRT